MKNERMIVMALLAAVCLSLCACGKETAPSLETAGGPAALFDSVTMETGAMSLAVFDGKTGWMGWHYRNYGQILDALKKVSAVPVEGFGPEHMTYPVYSFELPARDGMGLVMTWTNGYLIDRNGQAYRFPFDFSTQKKEDWEDVRAISWIPGNLRFLSVQDGKWLFDRLYVVPETTVSADVEASVQKITADGITVSLSNHGSESLVYGEGFGLEVSDGTKWYAVPGEISVNWGFLSIGYPLPAGETVTATYATAVPYGTLPAGHYRISPGVNGRAVHAEFDVP